MQGRKQSRIELIRPIAECSGSCSLAMDRDDLDLGEALQLLADALYEIGL